jgi:hypothetical protein
MMFLKMTRDVLNGFKKDYAEKEHQTRHFWCSGCMNTYVLRSNKNKLKKMDTAEKLKVKQLEKIDMVEKMKATAQILFSVQDDIPDYVEMYMQGVAASDQEVLKKFMKHHENGWSLWGLEKQLKTAKQQHSVATLSVNTDFKSLKKKRKVDWNGDPTSPPDGYFTEFCLGQLDALPQHTVMRDDVGGIGYGMDRYLDTVGEIEEAPSGKMFDGSEWVEDSLADWPRYAANRLLAEPTGLECDENMPEPRGVGI